MNAKPTIDELKAAAARMGEMLGATAAYARNNGYSWAALRSAFAGYPLVCPGAILFPITFARGARHAR